MDSLPPAGAAATGVVAVVPAFNEADRVVAVLDGLDEAGLAEILIVDDGSTDGTGALVDAWVASHAGARAIHLAVNAGKSAALRAAWDVLRGDLAAGRLSADTLIVGVDADGQHDLAYLQLLIERIRDVGADAVIARRDLSYHRPYKRLGNRVMTAIGSLCAGTRLHDVECGYRVVRLGPLLAAQAFYRGTGYSEAAELIVVLARLGYRVDNDLEVHVPDGRTRTRLSDAARHAVAMVAAWYRVAAWRDVPGVRHSRAAAVASLALLAVFATFLLAILRQPFFLGNDSAQSYAHVWFIQHALAAGHGIPWRMPMLEGGRAWTFPYALIPWVPLAALRALVGDWAVTAGLVGGVLLLVVGLWAWLPRTRSPLITALLVLNPQLYGALAQFQLPSLWALAFAALSAAASGRGRPAVATLLATATIYAHPLVGTAALGVTLLVAIEEERRLPRARIAGLLVAGLLGLPAYWMFLTTPLAGEAGLAALLVPVWLTLKRLSILGWAWVGHRFAPQVVRAWPLLAAVAVLVLANDIRHVPPTGLWDASRARFGGYVEAGRVDPRATYRVLVTTNHEDGMVQILEAGGTLSHEFFDESVQRSWWGSAPAYRCFLDRRGVDRVLLDPEYARVLDWSDEPRLLAQLVELRFASVGFRGADGTIEYHLSGAAPEGCPAPRTAR